MCVHAVCVCGQVCTYMLCLHVLFSVLVCICFCHFVYYVVHCLSACGSCVLLPCMFTLNHEEIACKKQLPLRVEIPLCNVFMAHSYQF